MENNVENVLSSLSGHVKSIASTDTVIGEEFTIGGFICKPVMKVGIGFGTASGSGDDTKWKGKGSGTAAGTGIGMTPIGFLVTKGDDISFVPSNEKKGLQAIFDKVPDLIDKVMEMKCEKDKKGNDTNSEKEKK